MHTSTELYGKFLEAYSNLLHGKEQVERLEAEGKTDEEMALRLKLINDFNSTFPHDYAKELEALVEHEFYGDDN